MEDEKMFFTLNDFSANVPNTFRQFWNDKDFTDVTLATEDDQQISAHKVILSSFSQFFTNILIKNQHQNPLIYLKGIRYAELEMVLKFIYCGECSVANEELQDFLAAGIDLMVNGLMEYQDEIIRNDKITPQELVHNTMENKSQKPIMDTFNISQKAFTRNSQNQQVAKIQDIEKFDYKSNNGFKSFGSPWNHKKTVERNLYECDQCGHKSKKKSHLQSHQENKHGGLRYSCDQCEYKTTSKSYLNSHHQNKHEGLRYTCDQCELKATSQRNLKVHQQSIHEGVRYTCAQCEYQATSQSHLKLHKLKNHEGVRFSCDQCEYKATEQRYLREHQQIKHEGLKYNCKSCEHKANSKYHLKLHQQSIHECASYRCDQCAYKAT